jgi:peroxiredoxin
VSKIEAGQSAPNPTFGRSDGSDVTLAELRRDGPVVLAFLRHFG